MRSRDTKATILTEAGADVGLGHLARCVALYDALVDVGCECEIVVEGESAPHVVGERRARSAEWRSPDDAARAVAEVEIAVVDSYLAPIETYAVIAETVMAAAYLDDTARLPYPKGFVVNGNPGASTLAWPAGCEAEPLLGMSYQLLRSEFVGLPERDIAERVRRVLVLAGGAGSADLFRHLGAVAESVFGDARLEFADTPRDAAGMLRSMLSADVAISAAGQTLYELCATGTPTVAVAVADNQVSQAQALADRGAIMYAGSWSDRSVMSALRSTLSMIRDNAALRRTLSARARALVDGRGAERVARRLRLRVTS